MTAAARPEPDPMLRLRYYRETGQAELAGQYERYLRETGQFRGDDKTAARQAEYASGRLERRMAAESALDKAAAANDATEIGAGFQNMLDAGTFGAGGLLDDAISAMSPAQGGTYGERFRANRDARQTARRDLPLGPAVVTGLAGASLNPLRILKPAAQGAGLLARAATRVGEGALQGGAAALGENVGTTEGATTATVAGATAGGLLGGAIPAATRLAQKATNLSRIFNSPSLGKVSDDMYRRMAVVDDVLYGKVREEAGEAGTTPAIREVLDSQTIKPFADLVRREEATSGLNDAETLIEAYKLMSRAQRKSLKSTEGTAEYLAELELRGQSIGKAKGRLLDVASRESTERIPAFLEGPEGRMVDLPGAASRPAIAEVVTPAPIPSLRLASREHAESMGEIRAFEHVSNAVRDILYGKSLKGEKLPISSPEALTKAIKQMTPQEAEAALKAVYGRGREVVRLSSNPIGEYGIRPSLFHAARAPGQMEPFVKLLEEQALKRSPVPTLMDAIRDRGPGVAARTTGGLLDY